MTDLRIINLRSDTKTLPTEEMLRAIKHAELGDDQDKEDPTVNKLQELAAKKLGKEDALLLTSGTHRNLVSLLSQTKPRDEGIVGMTCYLYNAEAGGSTRIAGLVLRPLPETYGVVNPEDIEKAIRLKNVLG